MCTPSRHRTRNNNCALQQHKIMHRVVQPVCAKETGLFERIYSSALIDSNLLNNAWLPVNTGPSSWSCVGRNGLASGINGAGRDMDTRAALLVALKNAWSSNAKEFLSATPNRDDISGFSRCKIKFFQLGPWIISQLD